MAVADIPVRQLRPGTGHRRGEHRGFYDRTLAALTKSRAVVGYSQAAVATIYPLRHDIPMDVIVTEETIVERSAS
jgi:5-formyltetrahydrofolate cyclo-ligase